jgi:penicillin-binding protein 1A
VTQARRLPGSGFKPFLYSAALEHGFTPASIILDAPIVLDGNGEDTWRPENSTREFGGPTRLRDALVRSRILVSIRILKEIGIGTAIDYITRFGFDARALPHDLTLALGTMEATPLDVASGYAVFANGGYRVQPYFIERIEDAAGQVVWRAAPRRACLQCEQPAAPGVPGEAAAALVHTPDATHRAATQLTPAEGAARMIRAHNR